MEILSSKLAIVEKHVTQIEANKARYQAVADPLHIPWYFVAAVHTMESGRNFKRHLHNGDPLSKRTRQVPKGRPKTGEPPFTWEESALDALTYQRLDRVSDWSLPALLYQLERYNGWGYRRYHPHVKSPYLWSYSDHYTSGKYIADGTYSDTAVSRQSGAAVIIRRMEQRGLIPVFGTDQAKKSFFKLSNKREPRARDLQRFLNSFEGISLLVDGIPGKKTSAACQRIFGHYLKGDQRNKE